MKKIFFFILFVMFCTNVFSQNTPDWSWIHPRPQGNYINWVKMIDANTWYAVGDYGLFMKTTNAGVNWSTKSVGFVNATYAGSPIFTVNKSGYFFNAMTGFIGPQSARGVLKTTNGGLTFDTIAIIPSGFGTVYGMNFINNNTGYLASNSALGYLRRTTDGGMTWNIVPVAGTTTIYNVYAADTNNIIYCTTAGNVNLTTNAGANWTTVNVGATGTIYNMKFINSSTGYICGSSGLFRYTTNGGVNWAGNSLPVTSSMYSIMLSGSDIYIAGTSSTQDMFKTTDLGTTWTTINYATGGTITGFNAYWSDMIGSTIVHVGTYGEIMRSTNSGTSWTSPVYRRSLTTMNDIYAYNGNSKVIAMGTNGSDVLLYSNDGGTSWTTASYSTLNNLSCLQMLNPNTGYVSGRYGQFLKTTDGGVTWDTSKSNNPTLIPYFCNGVHFINEQTGWIVGGVPGVGGVTKIFKTTDAGSNWTEQSSAYTGPVGVKVKFWDANTGYMTHSAGLQYTTNGGINWTLCTTPSTSASYTPLCLTNATTIFTGGNNSQVYSTTNGGMNWDSLNFPVKAGTIFTVDFINYNTGFAGGLFGCIGKTTNHGQTWQVNTNGGYTTYAIDAVSADTAFAVCGNTGGAQIFKYMKGLTNTGFTYENVIPKDFSLKQNYPNPFNPVTTIEFNIPKQSVVSIKIFDMLGREYQSEISSMNLGAGNYKMNFNASELSSGIYFYSLVVNGQNLSTKRMAIVK